MVRLRVDFECPSPAWWEEGGRDLWASVAGAEDAAGVVLDESIARSWLDAAAQLPGWDAGHEFAPHPIALEDFDPEDPDS